jgi:hypothetical protein
VNKPPWLPVGWRFVSGAGVWAQLGAPIRTIRGDDNGRLWIRYAAPDWAIDLVEAWPESESSRLLSTVIGMVHVLDDPTLGAAALATLRLGGVEAVKKLFDSLRSDGVML